MEFSELRSLGGHLAVTCLGIEDKKIVSLFKEGEYANIDKARRLHLNESQTRWLGFTK